MSIYAHYLYNVYASQLVLVVKNPPAICNAGDLRDEVRSLGQEDSLGRKWQPTPVFLPGESQGQGSLVRCRLWGRTQSDMTEAT